MRVKVQRCWGGSDRYYYRALICGGLLVRVADGEYWNRRVASRMLDLIEAETGHTPCALCARLAHSHLLSGVCYVHQNT